MKMSSKALYECLVDCWKLFLIWIKRYKDDPEGFNITQMRIELDKKYEKYVETDLKLFSYGLLSALITQMDEILTNKITID